MIVFKIDKLNNCDILFESIEMRELSMKKIIIFVCTLFIVYSPVEGMSWFRKKQEYQSVDPVKYLVQPYLATIKTYAIRFPKTTGMVVLSALGIASYYLYKAVDNHFETVVGPQEYLKGLIARR